MSTVVVNGETVDTQTGEVLGAAPGRAIVLFGYAGRRVADLAAWIRRRDAVVLDIRDNPRSGLPGWNDYQLAAALGDRYQRCRAWGNVNYADRAKPIEIRDFEAGWLRCQELRCGPKARMVVLLCVCRKTATCHGLIIGQLIFGRFGFRVGQLELPDAPPVGKPRAQPAAPAQLSLI